MRTFNEYKLLKEEKEHKPLNAKITLGEGNNFKPFFVSDDPKSQHYGQHQNLAPIIRAFKNGANWGWTRDEEGQDKPVKIAAKKLYLTGGAVRSHLKNEKPRNIELATNASPDEIYRILKQNDFKFVEDKKQCQKCFSIENKTSNGRPVKFKVYVKNDEYELEPMMKTPRGIDDDPEMGSHEQDAASRDFTINSMYILLSNDDGPNKELIDFYGGVHDIASNSVEPIGGVDAFENNPKRMMRFPRFLTHYGNPESLTDEFKNSFKKHACGCMKNLDREYMQKEFSRGISQKAKKFLQVLSELGLDEYVFPNSLIDSNIPKEIEEFEDPDVAVAWTLRLNPIDQLNNVPVESNMMKKINFLIKILDLSDKIDTDELESLTNMYHLSGIPGRKLKNWSTKLGHMPVDLIDAFLRHAKGEENFFLSDEGLNL